MSFPDVFPNWRFLSSPKKVVIRYGIRRISDGFYMPQPNGRGGRGGSFMEPEDPLLPFCEVRLFHSERAAKSALAQWRRGKHWHKVTGGSWDTDADEYTSIEHVPGRDTEVFDIVPIRIQLP